MTSDGVAKLSDFGLGAMRDEGQDIAAMKTVCGTPNYAAPEVINKLTYDGCAADIWSLGVVCYVILAGCLPFDGTYRTGADVRRPTSDVLPRSRAPRRPTFLFLCLSLSLTLPPSSAGQQQRTTWWRCSKRCLQGNIRCPCG